MGGPTGSVVDDTITNLGVEDIVGGYIPDRVARIGIIRESDNGQDARAIRPLTSAAAVV